MAPARDTIHVSPEVAKRYAESSPEIQERVRVLISSALGGSNTMRLASFAVPALVAENGTLYDEDFYAWTQHTADLVRTGQWHAIDPEVLAEELESLGKSQKRELENRLEVLVMHLLKWEYQPELRATGHSWYDTILEQRSQIARLLRDNPSLRPQVPALLVDVYPDARQRARGEMRGGGPRTPLGQQDPLALIEAMRLDAHLPSTCPWRAAQILDKDFWPGPL